MVNNFWNYANLGKGFYRKCFDSICKKHDLTDMEMDVLMFLYHSDGKNTASDLIELRGFAKSNVSLAIKSLVLSGHVEGVYENGDRRKIHLYLLDRAIPIVQEGVEAEQKFKEAITAGFSQEEIATMKKNMERILANIKKMQED